MIQIKNVTKKYGNTIVVDDVSLDLEKGKVISIIGPNGAGKSTLLGMVSRTLKKRRRHCVYRRCGAFQLETTANCQGKWRL